MLGLQLERDYPPAFTQPTRQPDRAISTQRPDLQNPPCPNHLRHQHQQLAEIRRNLNPRQTRRPAVGQRLLQRLILPDQLLIDIRLNPSPKLLIHSAPSCALRHFNQRKNAGWHGQRYSDARAATWQSSGRKNAPRMVGRGASEGEKKAVGLLLLLTHSPLLPGRGLPRPCTMTKLLRDDRLL